MQLSSQPFWEWGFGERKRIGQRGRAVLFFCDAVAKEDSQKRGDDNLDELRQSHLAGSIGTYRRGNRRDGRPKSFPLVEGSHGVLLIL